MLFKKLKKPDPEAETRLLNEIEEHGGLEKNDVPAMIISAMLMILPIAFVALFVICMIALWFL